jgi:erythritol transport system substrate-binding protein
LVKQQTSYQPPATNHPEPIILKHLRGELHMTSRKFLQLITLLLISALFLVACGSSNTPAADTPAPAPDTAAPAEDTAPAADSGQKLIVVITPSHDNPFFGAMADIAVATAQELGYETLSLVHDDDANKQSQALRHGHRPRRGGHHPGQRRGRRDGSAVQAADAGIPTFLVDREITQDGVAAAQIVSNNYQGATILAEYFVRVNGRRRRVRGADRS